MSLNELMAMSQGAYSPEGKMYRKPAGLGGLKIPAQRHCAQPMCPKALGLLGYQCSFSSTVFLLLRKDENTFFFFSMFQTLFLVPVFQRTLKCFIFIPSQNKDILQ